jgi:hypothetical protein
VLHRCHLATAFTERSRVVEASGLLGDSRDERIDIGSVEDDSVVRAGRVKDDADMAARVQPDSGEPDATGKGVLCAHSIRDLHAGCHGGPASLRAFSRDRGLRPRRDVWRNPLTCGFSATRPACWSIVQNAG